MRSKVSYFSISPVLIRENIKRFWSISVLSFIGYFLSGVLPILLNVNRGMENGDSSGIGYMVRSLLNNQYFPHAALHLVVPVVASVILYRYLHSPGSATMVHGLPFTRAQLFNSNLGSGLILIWLPLLVTAGILLLLSRPMYLYEGSTEDIFTNVLVLQWLWKSLIVTLSVYLVAVLAGVVSGNGVMHMFLGFWFNGLLPGFYAVCVAYFDKFFFGFDGTSQLLDIAAGMMPYLKAIQSNQPFSLPLMIYYVLGMMALLALSSYLYHKRDLEKAGDSLVFSGVKILICYLIAFFGMSLMAFFFDTISWPGADNPGGHFMFYFGLLIGILVFLFIGRMVVVKSPRVFNKASLKHLGIYTLIALVFVVSVDLDFTGFEKRVPNPSKVQGVSLWDLGNMEMSGRYERMFFGSLEEDTTQAWDLFQEPENIAAVSRFHQELISDKFEIGELPYDGQTYSLSLSYHRNTLWDLTRSYVVPLSTMKESENLKGLYESREFKERYSFENLTVKEPRWIKVYNMILYQTTMDQYSMTTVDNRVEIRELMEQLEKDYQQRTWAQHLDRGAPYAQMELAFYGLPNKGNDYPTYAYDGSSDPTLKVMNITVKKSDKNTISWLEEKGYHENLRLQVEDIDSITVFHEAGGSVAVKEMEYKKEQWAEDPMSHLAEKPQVRFDKPEDIARLLEEYQVEVTDYQDYYYGIISFKKSAPYAHGFYEHYSTMYQSMDTAGDTITVDYYVYFNHDSLPDIIRKAFP